MTKITINEQETYIISIPETMTLNSLKGLTLRLQKLVKFLDSENISVSQQNSRTRVLTKPLQNHCSINSLGLPSILSIKHFKEKDIKKLNELLIRDKRKVYEEYSSHYSNPGSTISTMKWKFKIGYNK